MDNHDLLLAIHQSLGQLGLLSHASEDARPPTSSMKDDQLRQLQCSFKTMEFKKRALAVPQLSTLRDCLRDMKGEISLQRGDELKEIIASCHSNLLNPRPKRFSGDHADGDEEAPRRCFLKLIGGVFFVGPLKNLTDRLDIAVLLNCKNIELFLEEFSSTLRRGLLQIEEKELSSFRTTTGEVISSDEILPVEAILSIIKQKIVDKRGNKGKANKLAALEKQGGKKRGTSDSVPPAKKGRGILQSANDEDHANSKSSSSDPSFLVPSVEFIDENRFSPFQPPKKMV